MTLYRNKKYNKSLVIFNLDKGKVIRKAERLYFMALTHFKMNNSYQALIKFKSCKTIKHPIYSPASAFYEGLIQFNKKNYSAAKAPFEFVLDQSKDSKLDLKAERYLELILTLNTKIQTKRNSIGVGIGLSYDNNVLLTPNGTAFSNNSNQESARISFSSYYIRKLINKEKHILSVKMQHSNYYSAKDELSVDDPYIGILTIPYSYKSRLFDKAFKFTISPGYETLFMPPDISLPPSNLLNSIVLSTNYLFLMNTHWHSMYHLNFRSEDSVPISSFENNPDALNITLKTDQFYYFNKIKSKYITSSIGYTINEAQGINKSYKRMDLSLSYSSKWKRFKLLWSSQVALYKMDYTDLDKRSDTNINTTLGIQRGINNWLSLSLSYSYTNNESNISTNTYDKNIFNTGLNANYNF